MLLERVESMIKGIGVDATELERVAKIIERRPHFVERILTPAEQTLFASHSQDGMHVKKLFQRRGGPALEKSVFRI